MPVRLPDIRSRIQSEYLDSNSIISGAEAKDLVKHVAGDALTHLGKTNLDKIRAEFKDSFSEAGLREFDKALARAAESLPPRAAAAAAAVRSPFARVVTCPPPCRSSSPT